MPDISAFCSQNFGLRTALEESRAAFDTATRKVVEAFKKTA